MSEPIDFIEAPPTKPFPITVYVYRDLNGTLVLCEDVEAIPDRKIGEPVAEYRLERTKTFRIIRQLHD